MNPAPVTVWRSLPRRSLLGGCAAALLLGGALASTVDGAAQAVLLLRGAALLLACSLAFALDDAAATVLAASPTPLRHRVAAAVAVAAVAPLAAWTVLLVGTAAITDGVPALGLTVELLGLAGLGLAVSAGLRTWRGVIEPGVLAAPVVAGALLAASQLPERWALLVPDPQSAAWDGAMGRWAAVLLVAAAVVLVATRDPAARSAG